MGKEELHYKNIPIRAAGNLHKKAIELIKGLEIPPGSTFLDLGAGEGAFSKRLQDNNYRVTAVELEKDRFYVEGITCLDIDLNTSFSEIFSFKYDFIIAFELLEHMENPWHFLRECYKILKVSGYLLISSPNVESWKSRLVFLKNGCLDWFSEKDYYKYGHYNPIFYSLIKIIASETGFKILKFDHTCNKLLVKNVLKGANKFKNYLILISFILLKPFMKGNISGEINLFSLQKQDYKL